MAADRFELALSLFYIYGSEVGFKMSCFEDLVAAVEIIWDLTPDSTGFLHNKVSIHIQQKMKECTKKGGSQSREYFGVNVALHFPRNRAAASGLQSNSRAYEQHT